MNRVGYLVVAALLPYLEGHTEHDEADRSKNSIEVRLAAASGVRAKARTPDGLRPLDGGESRARMAGRPSHASQDETSR